MLNVIWICRCLLFGVFIVSNAIICSVAVWNFFIAQAVNHFLQVDAFLIIIGAFALAFIIVVIVTGTVRRNSVVARVWFECLWVALFFILEFSGAVALSATVPGLMCSTLVVVTGSCSSTQVLVAFTWICSLFLLAYFFLLFITALVHSKNDRRVWSRAIRHMTLSEMPESSAPPLPPPRSVVQRRSLMSIVAPRPRTVVPSTLYAFSGGFGNDAGFQGDIRRHASNRQSNIPPPLPVAAPPRRMVQRARESTLPAGYSLYPQNVQVAMSETPAARGQPRNTREQQPAQPRPRHQQRTPPPLGNWPRADVLSQPVVRGKPRRSSQNRQQPSQQRPPYMPSRSPPSSPKTAPPNRPMMTIASPPPTAPLMSLSQSQQRTRPSGPRSHTHTQRSRPPPLDLTGINSYGRKI